MFDLESTKPTAEPDDRLELAHLLAAFMAKLSERQHGVLVRTLALRGQSAQTLEAVGCDLGVTRERVRAIGQQALGNLKKAALASGLTLETTPERPAGAFGFALEPYRGTATDRADRWAFWGQRTLTKFVKSH